MALGTRHAKLDDKLHALFFAIHHEAGNWKAITGIREGITSVTTDWGVESKMADAAMVDFDA
eukprot:8196080-Alexandrium_andersonii.AAC.1